MQTFFSEDHRYHFPQAELSGGQFVTPYERPSRVEFVLSRLKERGLGDIVAPPGADLKPARRILDEGFLRFLETAWDEWKAAGMKGEVIAAGMPTRRQRHDRIPRNIDGKVEYYCHASETAITQGTWRAALSSLASAQAAQRAVAGGARAAFGLCRPPGHHATSDQYGGYCFLNNAAVAAEMFRLDGAARVAVLDIDFHHGNGTQDIFWRRGDVLFASIHGDPLDSYPYFAGFADETGEGEGEGCTLNVPLPPGTGYGPWSAALDDLIARIRDFGAEALVVSLGVDAYKDDPISFFRLDSPDFTDAGRRIGRMGLPTVFLMEGGYAIEQVGVNTVNVLEGFLDA
ncbi:histone deacetylase family protein [Rubellimicrobium sp. CFH 75288]|uniref:histone deacetylase family protein n=1 Tax=Rubellimicrobium sp. CFH 75288 TaxID=2697034 RepID=UPI001412CC7E|nr:histone deacetylase family protein [Rubellimicrobium sp. CFH 75288]NAZ36156.1 histone deacetylase family protein [Rubellimicrobium sp. CFH 75288]